MAVETLQISDRGPQRYSHAHPVAAAGSGAPLHNAVRARRDMGAQQLQVRLEAAVSNDHRAGVKPPGRSLRKRFYTYATSLLFK